MIESLKQKFNKKYSAIVVATLLVCILLVFVVYVTSASRFTIENIVVCKNLDKDRLPIDIIQGETTSCDRAILCFDYSEAKVGLTLRVTWYYNDKQVTNDTLKLSRLSGTHSMVLLANNGSALPAGAYCVKISLGDKVLKQISFIIS